MADTNTYISKQKTEKWTTKEKFNALNLSDIPVGTEYNLTGAIEEGELDADLQAKINGKLTAPAKPTAESAIVLGTDGTTSTKALSELGGKLYRHDISFLTPVTTSGSTSKPSYVTVYFSIYSSNSNAITKENIEEISGFYPIYAYDFLDNSGPGCIFISNKGSLEIFGVMMGYDTTSLTYLFSGANKTDIIYENDKMDTVTEL